MSNHDDERRLPPPIDEKLLTSGRTADPPGAHTPAPAPRYQAQGRTIAFCGPQRPTTRPGRYPRTLIDLWQKVRLAIWRAKHSKRGLTEADPVTRKRVLTFIADDKMVLAAINTARGILDSMVKLRREMGHDATAIPRWALEKIERALRDYPEARHALLKALAAEDDKIIQ